VGRGKEQVHNMIASIRSGRCVVAIDPSLTGFAMTARYSDGTVFEKELTSKPQKTLAGRVRRIRTLAHAAEDFLKLHAPELCLMEGYAYGAKGRSVISLGELGGVVRDHVVGIADHTVEVAPATLKRFVTGRGNSPKMDVVQKLVRKFDREFKTDNLADSFGLAQLGAVVVGYMDAVTRYEREAAGVVLKQLQQEPS